MAHILVVDDDREWANTIKDLLNHTDHTVSLAHSGHACLEQLATCQPELIILDINMPGLNGFDTLERIRARSDVPVLVLSVEGDIEENVVEMLRDRGGDDIIPKTAGVDEIRARVDALLRLVNRLPEPPAWQRYDDGVLEIDLASEMTVTKRGKMIHLTPKESAFLRVLLENKGEIVPHQEILQKVWGDGYEDQTTYLAVFMRYLRAKLEDDPSEPEYLVTKHRQGYGFVSGPHDGSKTHDHDDSL